MQNAFRPQTFAELQTRRCAKWRYYPSDVLPLWVAQMDFALADGIKTAIKEHVDSDDLGYPAPGGLAGLREAVVDRVQTRYGGVFPLDGVAALASTVDGMVVSVRAFTQPGDEVLLLTPLYPPFKRSVVANDRVAVEVELTRGEDGYAIDWDALRGAVTPRTRMLMLCNPHNPIGKVFTRAELEGLAQLALEHGLWVVSDELHADLSFVGGHVPFASLSPEVAARTVTLYGPTKAFNFPGLGISFALTRGPDVLEGLAAASGGRHSSPSRLAETATLAAYTRCDDWLEQALDYLEENRDRVVAAVRERMPGVSVHVPDATYLAWLDMRGTALADAPAKRLVETAKVGLNEGAEFGKGGTGFVRLNFATSQEVLDEALTRVAAAVSAAG